MFWYLRPGCVSVGFEIAESAAGFISRGRALRDARLVVLDGVWVLRYE